MEAIEGLDGLEYLMSRRPLQQQGQDQQWQWTLNFLEELRGSRQEPDVITFSAVSSACEKTVHGSGRATSWRR